ncbi:enoyl-CoA hydratase, partial [Streptococcus suis]
MPVRPEMYEAIRLAEGDPSLNIFQIQGQGSIFCVGGDLGELMRAGEADGMAELVTFAVRVNVRWLAVK